MSYTRFRIPKPSEEQKSGRAPANQVQPTVGTLTPGQSRLLTTQQTWGNQRAVQQFAVQRIPDEDPYAIEGGASQTATEGGAPQGTAQATETPGGGDYPVDLTAQDPLAITLVPASGPGDYPMPADPNTAMAKRIGEPIVQRDDDDKPTLGLDVASGWTFPLMLRGGAPAPTPWTLQTTLVYRNVNLRQLMSGHFGLDILHEPSFTIGIDPSGGISSQEAITLFNLHWRQPWNRELEVGLSAVAQQNLLPQFSQAYGGQLQAEQHILPWFSVTVSAGGMWTPPQGGQRGQFALTGGPGALFHF